MVGWDRWCGAWSCGRGVVQWWTPVDTHYFVDEKLRSIVEEETTVGWTCDISDIAGFAASQSELSDFSSTDALVTINRRPLIEPCTEEKLAEK